MEHADSPAKYAHIVRAVYERPWAILPSTLALILDVIQFRALGGVLSDAEIESRIQAASNGPRTGGRQAGTVGLVPIYGVLSARQHMIANSSGGTSVERIAADFQAHLADPAVDGIVLDIDSPGGSVDGIEEFAQQIRDARSTKPIVAVANQSAYSAAYWLGAQAHEMVVTPSGGVGSVGIFAAHQDISGAAEREGLKTTLISAGKFKVEGNQWEPLSDEARQEIQRQVDEFYGMFVSSVAKGRGVSVDSVRSDFGQGRGLLAKAALAAGMVDRIETLDSAIRRVARGAVKGFERPAAAATTTVDVAALGPGLPYAERLQLVSAAARDLAEHSEERAAMRATEGRELSAATRTGLRALGEQLLVLGAEPDEEPSEPDPDLPAAPGRRVDLEVLEAAARGGYVLPSPAS